MGWWGCKLSSYKSSWWLLGVLLACSALCYRDRTKTARARGWTRPPWHISGHGHSKHLSYFYGSCSDIVIVRWNTSTSVSAITGNWRIANKKIPWNLAESYKEQTSLICVIVILWGSTEFWRKAWRETFNAMSSENLLWTGSIDSRSTGSVGRNWTELLETIEQKYQK